MATVAGVLMARWLRYTGPDTTLSFAIMIDILLMVVIGGMGTLYGSVLGATIFILAENYLQVLMGELSDALAGAGIPVLPVLFQADRWLLWRSEERRVGKECGGTFISRWSTYL